MAAVKKDSARHVLSVASTDVEGADGVTGEYQTKDADKSKVNSSAIRFPEHASGLRISPTWKETIYGFGKHDSWKIKCEQHVLNVLRNSAPVKLLNEALKSVGCEFDISRHVLCEHCDESVGGGFDPANRQIVICQNVSTTEGKVTSVLAHEMIHAFDYCRSTFDYNNVDHIACSEVRASALTHCSYISAMFQGTAVPWNFKNRHQDCVKIKATESVMSAKGLPLEQALASVEKVFPKCYADLEPFGLVPRRNSRDCNKAYYERFYYGYGS